MEEGEAPHQHIWEFYSSCRLRYLFQIQENTWWTTKWSCIKYLLLFAWRVYLYWKVFLSNYKLVFCFRSPFCIARNKVQCRYSYKFMRLCIVLSPSLAFRFSFLSLEKKKKWIGRLEISKRCFNPILGLVYDKVLFGVCINMYCNFFHIFILGSFFTIVSFAWKWFILFIMGIIVH